MKFLKYLTLVFAFFFLGCEPCDELTLEVCGGNEGPPMVDLIILIDQSSSMGTIANTISNAAVTALDSAKMECPTDLVTHFLAVDGTWLGTVFNTSHRQFIYTAQGTTVPLASDVVPVGYTTELGAHAIEDLSNFAPWREGACRAIFYISDEELDGSDPQGDFANETAATKDAIASAIANEVTVFTNFIDVQNLGASIMQNYDDLTGQTGGFNLVTPTRSAVTSQLYIDLMPQIVCNSCKACELSQLMNAN
ncbi:hypothetical protein [Neolewinella agarilytica]|uniref:VWFA domain-containing protein n=1 Tax=Neolewinella agarilytica TaxID=478744 RepID=A0A1H9HA84_9BACT|nr:hypothetical protein [Neolewinella agarilytica]SEQ59279.1 hypothetical protein SAMN05444359_11280 [Neolewinella agarilytica]